MQRWGKVCGTRDWVQQSGMLVDPGRALEMLSWQSGDTQERNGQEFPF